MPFSEAERIEKYIMRVAERIEDGNKHSVEAEDLAQVGRVAVWRARGMYDGEPSGFIYYAMSSAKHAMVNYAVQCSVYRRHCVGLDVADVASNGDDVAEAVIDRLMAEQFNGVLTDAERVALCGAMSGKARKVVDKRRELVAMRLLQRKYTAFVGEF